MLQTNNLSYNYPRGEAIHFPDIECRAGQTHLVLGRSGSGKTTLLNLIAGLLKPKAGSVVIDGESINELSGTSLDKFRGRNIGLIFQEPHFVQSLTVVENIMLAQKLAGKKPERQKALELLTQLGIAGKASSRPAELSSGERQRTAIARAIINKPALLLADEPTSALDDDNCRAVVKLLEELAEKNKSALVVVTHDSRLKSLIENKTTLN
ncbi:MAG: ABC transporter ATP-binding protein [Saprospirales bacterium]|nr:MAG: ABC transporter ATP-binding protein [Saprospirales bacterium]